MASIEKRSEKETDFGTLSHYDIMLDGEKIGTVAVEHYDTDDSDYVEGIYIDEQYRGRGIGTEILTENFMGAYIAADNEDAARLYDRICRWTSEDYLGDWESLDQGFGVCRI